ncbi:MULTISPECIES: flagellar brake protein [Shewanella]|uniref:Type IV pilus assembly PilZ n=1 Tax=Shewanella japonica TaxID=93973 RepID=A0ABM6JGN4_9GAMM|nr:MULTISPECIES: flagellar brake protein [Shewanella]ARD20452.1 Type IV pilus assembly PilZ [Shewanella japonica]KPZ67607.1 Flagellar brake protein YcgR [Shewanella sp. P1-14-1]
MTEQASPEEPVFFTLTPGRTVDLQIDFPVKFRIKATLVGYEMGKYIILKHPAPQQMNNYKDVFVEGNGVVVRYLLEGQQGECYAFKSIIRNITKIPEKFIFLSYPKQIENRQLRTHQRYTTHLPAMIQAKGENDTAHGSQLRGIISDISIKGCGFVFKADNPKVKVSQKDITVTIRNTNNEDIYISAKVCNSRFEHGKVNVGIQFENDDEQVKTLLTQLYIDL